MVRVRDTLIPLIFKSNGTHLSNFVGDKNDWPVYMTIGNLSSKMHLTPSTHSVVMVALLPIPIKNHNIREKRLDELGQRVREVLNKELRWLLQPLIFTPNPSSGSRYYNVFCADGNFSGCKQVLAAWLADCPEYSDLHHLERHVCAWCECPKNELGDYVHPDKQRPRRDHNLYRPLNDSNTKAANADLLSPHVHQGLNVIHNITCTVSDLAKFDLLHTMQIGMVDHLQRWIFHFMKTHEWLDKYNAIWLSVPACHDLRPKNKSYEEVA